MEPNPPAEPTTALNDDRFHALITLVTPREPPGPPENFKLKYLELSVSLVKAVAWPLFAVFILWLFRGPIYALAEKLPEIIQKADSFKVSAGTSGLALELQRAAQAAAREAGRPEIAQRIKDLSPTAIAELIRQNVSNHILVGSGLEPNTYTLPTDEDLKPVRELEKKDLVEFGPMSLEQFYSFFKQLPLKEEPASGGRLVYRVTKPLTEDETRKLREQYYRLTPQGQEVYKFLVDSIIKEAEPSSK